jgi:hypothetical protein
MPIEEDKKIIFFMFFKGKVDFFILKVFNHRFDIKKGALIK